MTITSGNIRPDNYLSLHPDNYLKSTWLLLWPTSWQLPHLHDYYFGLHPYNYLRLHPDNYLSLHLDNYLMSTRVLLWPTSWQLPKSTWLLLWPTPWQLLQIYIFDNCVSQHFHLICVISVLWPFFSSHKPSHVGRILHAESYNLLPPPPMNLVNFFPLLQLKAVKA